MIPSPLLANTVPPDMSTLFLELGLVFLALTIVARLSSRVGLSPIPLFLVVGMAFGPESPLAISISQDFIATTAEIGVLLLLFNSS